MKRIALLLAVAALGTACARPATPPGAQEPNPLEAPPVDAARLATPEVAAAFPYRREASADLDGDGRAERVVIASDVTLSAKGTPLWEDGHRWAVYAESADGRRTLLYAAFVPNGFAEAAVLAADSEGKRRVLVQERTSGQVRALEVEYLGPGTAKSRSAAHYQIEQWLPGMATLP
ncbi:MAG TPA: hypothetical protein VNC59_08360 [Thermoanaerobaculia bacterium]|nr:hypothetical protein [Thermoanaerobaculia bacterium]